MTTVVKIYQHDFASWIPKHVQTLADAADLLAVVQGQTDRGYTFRVERSSRPDGTMVATVSRAGGDEPLELVGDKAVQCFIDVVAEQWASFPGEHPDEIQARAANEGRRQRDD